MLRIIAATLLTLFLPLSNIALAADTLASDNATLENVSQDTFGTQNTDASEEEFLPVEEAYQVAFDKAGETLLIHWQIADGYYLYGHRFAIESFDGAEYHALQAKYPQAKLKNDEFFGEVPVYYHEVLAELPLAGLPEQVQMRVTSQGCADAGLCYPPYKLYFEVNTTTGAVTPTSKFTKSNSSASKSLPSSKLEQENSGFWSILLFAMLGGMILNLMPCVFPVLSLKVLSFSGQEARSAHARIHGLVYTIGIIASFLLVASVLVSLRAGGEAIGWGFQLQSTWFVALLTYLFFVMALGLAGMIELGSGWMGVGSQLAQRSGYSGSFFTGVLAVVVASPCTAPFMGTALGYALTQSPAVALSVFAALGFGMALPFLVLSELPFLMRYMPKPGPWMDSFKRLMSFPLFATCIWLLWVIGNQTSPTAMAMTLLGCLALATAVWLWREPVSKKFWHHVKNFSAVAATVCAIAVLQSNWLKSTDALSSQSNALKNWEPYSEARLEELRRAGKPVFVNVTADWCITCLANERIALGTDSVREAFQNHDITYLKADWTNHDASITALLSDYGRSGIPLYLMFPTNPDLPAQVLPQVLTVDLVTEKLAELYPNKPVKLAKSSE